MKTFFNIVMAFAATMILASSCNKESTNEPVQDNTVNFTATKLIGMHMTKGNALDGYIISLSDEEMTRIYMFSLNNTTGPIDDEGNVTVPSGTYMQSEEAVEFSITGYAIYRDITEGVDNAKSANLEQSTLVVTETNAVLTTVVEGVTHIVTYNAPLTMPADLPEADVDFEANYAYAYYSDDTQDDSISLFKLYLSDLGCDESGNELPNGTYYVFTLQVKRLDSNAEIAIPAGRYEIGDTGSSNGYIVSAEYHKFGESLSERAKYDYSNSGSLTVNEDGSIEANLDMYWNGGIHSITFSGEVEILENTLPSEPPYSTLTSDKECDLSNHAIDIWSREAPAGAGYNAYAVSINPNNAIGDDIVFEILCGTDKNADISGRYTVSNSLDEFTVVPGYIDGFTLASSWYYHKPTSMSISDYAPIVDGWVEISVTDKKTYTVTFDVYDDLNNNITGSWSYKAN
jgi:hypothetical protein